LEDYTISKVSYSSQT